MRMETITLPATLDSLALISEFVINSTSQAGLDERTAWQAQLAVDEGATKIAQRDDVEIAVAPPRQLNRAIAG